MEKGVSKILYLMLFVCPLLPMAGAEAAKELLSIEHLTPQKNQPEFTDILLISDDFPGNTLSLSVREVTLSRKQLKKRSKIKKSFSPEPLSIKLRKSPNLKSISRRIARKGMARLLYSRLSRNKKQLITRAGKNRYNLKIDSTILPLISNWVIKKASRKKSLIPYLDINALKGENLQKFYLHMSNFYTERELETILFELKLQQEEWVRADRIFFPKFARKNLYKYENVRGPNCFHSSIAFADPRISFLEHINIRREPDYHRKMINHNELWSALHRYYQPIDPRKTPLVFGDVIVFYDQDVSSNGSLYKSFKHATTYLFRGLLFNKNSKTAKTPYLILPLNMVFDQWKRRYHNLGYRIYRKNKTTKSPITYSLLDTF